VDDIRPDDPEWRAALLKRIAAAKQPRRSNVECELTEVQIAALDAELDKLFPE
jgi:hypothetical protein